MNAPAKKKAHVITSFTDAGTGESFSADDTPLIDAGAYANYEAAGLVRPATVERKKAAPAKPRRSTRRASPVPPPAPSASTGTGEVSTTE